MKTMKALAKDLLFTVATAGCVYGLAASASLFPLNAQAAESAANGIASAPATKTSTPVPATKSSAVAQPPGAAKSTTAVGAPTHYAPNPLSRRAELYYDLFWGVDKLKVKCAESNEVIRFNFRVLDPQKAKALNDEKNEPSLIAPRAGVKLVIPSLEKVGKLRQVSSPETGKMYWMAFSNKGRLVKPGDRVNVVIGNFHANGLIVQ